MLFGSAVSGRMRPESDVDVGIVPVDPDLPLGAELELQASLEHACGRPVDVIRLDRASPHFSPGPRRESAKRASDRAERSAERRRRTEQSVEERGASTARDGVRLALAAGTW